MESTKNTQPDPAVERLASELADVEASIQLVSTGVASRITLTGLRFGRQVATRLRTSAARRGVDLDASFWSEDTISDILVSQMAQAAGTPRREMAGRD